MCYNVAGNKYIERFCLVHECSVEGMKFPSTVPKFYIFSNILAERRLYCETSLLTFLALGR